MVFHETPVKDAFLIDLDPKGDERGFFARVWSARQLSERGLVSRFVECNMSRSRYCGTIRGLHYQVHPHEEAKLVRCTRGAVFDVVLDMRSDSPSLHRWAGFELRESACQALYVPPGCAHGIQTLEDDSEILYVVSAFYAPEAERGLRWDDPYFGIEWPDAERRIVSEKDSQWPDFQSESPVGLS